MKIKKIFSALVLLSICWCSSGALATPVKTESSNLEWAVLNQWQVPESPIDIVHSLDARYVFILTNQQKVLIYTAQGKLEGSVPVDKGVSAIDIAPRAEMLYLIDSEKNSFTSLSIDFVKQINTSGSPYRGLVDAPVTLAVFTDFE